MLYKFYTPPQGEALMTICLHSTGITSPSQSHPHPPGSITSANESSHIKPLLTTSTEHSLKPYTHVVATSGSKSTHRLQYCTRSTRSTPRLSILKESWPSCCSSAGNSLFTMLVPRLPSLAQVADFVHNGQEARKPICTMMGNGPTCATRGGSPSVLIGIT